MLRPNTLFCLVSILLSLHLQAMPLDSLNNRLEQLAWRHAESIFNRMIINQLALATEEENAHIKANYVLTPPAFIEDSTWHLVIDVNDKKTSGERWSFDKCAFLKAAEDSVRNWNKLIWDAKWRLVWKDMSFYWDIEDRIVYSDIYSDIYIDIYNAKYIYLLILDRFFWAEVGSILKEMEEASEGLEYMKLNNPDSLALVTNFLESKDAPTFEQVYLEQVRNNLVTLIEKYTESIEVFREYLTYNLFANLKPLELEVEKNALKETLGKLIENDSLFVLSKLREHLRNEVVDVVVVSVLTYPDAEEKKVYEKASLKIFSIGLEETVERYDGKPRENTNWIGVIAAMCKNSNQEEGDNQEEQQPNTEQSEQCPVHNQDLHRYHKQLLNTTKRLIDEDTRQKIHEKSDRLRHKVIALLSDLTEYERTHQDWSWIEPILLKKEVTVTKYNFMRDFWEAWACKNNTELPRSAEVHLSEMFFSSWQEYDLYLRFWAYFWPYVLKAHGAETPKHMPAFKERQKIWEVLTRHWGGNSPPNNDDWVSKMEYSWLASLFKGNDLTTPEGNAFGDFIHSVDGTTVLEEFWDNWSMLSSVIKISSISSITREIEQPFYYFQEQLLTYHVFENMLKYEGAKAKYEPFVSELYYSKLSLKERLRLLVETHEALFLKQKSREEAENIIYTILSSLPRRGWFAFGYIDYNNNLLIPPAAEDDITTFINEPLERARKGEKVIIITNPLDDDDWELSVKLLTLGELLEDELGYEYHVVANSADGLPTYQSFVPKKWWDSIEGILEGGFVFLV